MIQNSIDRRALDRSPTERNPEAISEHLNELPNNIASIFRPLFAVLALSISSLSLAAEQWLHYFPPADNANQQGFARIVNQSTQSGTLTISGIDDLGQASAGTITISVVPGQAVQFNSQDLEAGNADKGLAGALGGGVGSWRLRFESDLDLDIAGLFRNPDGFVNIIHDTAPHQSGTSHQVPFFNPASNVNQVSRIRLINTSSQSNQFSISGIDDNGNAGSGTVTLTLDPLASVELNALELEQGSALTQGVLGDGSGKWRLQVQSAASGRVMSLLEDPNGYLSNLSTVAVPNAAGVHALNFMLPESSAAQGFVRIINPTNSTAQVQVQGVDDSGASAPGQITLSLAANQSINFRSEFYEGGNISLGLQGSLGSGTGNWRLLVSADQSVDVMGLFRTPLGFLNTVHSNSGGAASTAHNIRFFNPGSNPNQVSVLRVSNLETSEIQITVTATDDSGVAGSGSVQRSIAALATLELDAATLEAEGIGDGTGKWTLGVTSSGMSYAQSILQAPDDYLSNLSSVLTLSDAQTGLFLDSPLINIGYRTATREGVTNGLGQYDYLSGETVTFFIGALEFPSAAASGIVTPLDLAGSASTSADKVVNIVRLLQSLDQDGNPENGITITNTAKQNAGAVNFDLSMSAFESSGAVLNVVAGGGQNQSRTTLVSAQSSLYHFETQLKQNSIDFTLDDTDGDGVGSVADAFPDDASESIDSDSDGIGDNSDVFPNDAAESRDTDGDGTGDNGDAFPEDASEVADSDGDGVGDNADAFPNDPNLTTVGQSGFQPGVFAASSTFKSQCANPRSGTEFSDVQGSTLDENNWLRSWSDETYLWYDEITDRDPAGFSNPLDYFAVLRTNAITPSGNPRDQFHFTFDSAEYEALSQGGVSAGYGTEFAIVASRPPRQVLVVMTQPDSPAAAVGLDRGAEILRIDGVDVINDNTAAGIAVLNAGLRPSALGETHTFEIRDLGATTSRTISLTSASITSTPVPMTKVISTPTGDVGYIQFNDHIATAEIQLAQAFSQLASAQVSDLVLDLRYNGGGFLAIAAQVGYMIAGPAQTGGRTFELLQFNDKHPLINPVTGRVIEPLAFLNQTVGFSAAQGQNLPFLNLSRVFVLTGSGTCSASEAIINGLRGVNVEVIQIGDSTCGKPYGFYPTDNCGTTYFTVQFAGVNDIGFGDYADGFSPQNTNGTLGIPITGCAVNDDLNHLLGDENEARLAAALQYRTTGTCPTPPASKPVAAKPGFGTPDTGLPIGQPELLNNRILGLPGEFRESRGGRTNR